jgi:Fe-Mn family superoxide dismutase
LSTWEHSYIYDFGLAGKRKYFEDWWAAIDWYRVEQRTPKEAGEAAGRSLLG